MNKNIKILLVILIVIFQPFVANVFSQQTTPSDFGTTGETGINPNDSQAPIDTYLILLLLTGCIFSFYKFQTVNKKRN